MNKLKPLLKHNGASLLWLMGVGLLCFTWFSAKWFGGRYEDILYQNIFYPLQAGERSYFYFSSCAQYGAMAVAFGALIAFYQHFTLRLGGRERFMEALPYTRRQQHGARLAMGMATLAVPMVLGLMASCLVSRPFIKEMTGYALAAPDYAKAAKYATLVFPATFMFKLLLLSLTGYAIAALMGSLFGNTLFALLFTGFCGLTALVFYTTVPQFCVYLDSVAGVNLFQGGDSIKQFIMEVSFPISGYQSTKMPWVNLSTFVGFHLLVTLGALLLSFMANQRAQTEKLTRVFTFKASRVLVVVMATLCAAFLGCVTFFAYNQELGKMVFSPRALAAYLVAVALVALIAFLIVFKGFKRIKGFKAIAPLLVLALSLTASASAGEPIPAQYFTFHTDTLKQQIDLLDALDTLNAEWYRNSSQSPQQLYDALTKGNGQVDSEVYASAASYETSIGFQESDPGSETWQKITGFLRQYGFNTLAQGLETDLAGLAALRDDPTLHSKRTVSQEGGVSYHLTGEKYGPDGVSVSLSFQANLPVSIKGAQDVESKMAQFPGMVKTSAYHNGQYAYEQYRYYAPGMKTTGEKNTSYEEVKIALILKDGEPLFITLRGDGLRSDAIQQMLAALLENKPNIAREAQALCFSLGKKEVDGMSIESYKESYSIWLKIKPIE